MNGYQPKKTCNTCLKWGICKKCKKDKDACKKYEVLPSKPPVTWTSVVYQKPIPMPGVKPAKQRTVLSVRYFAILYELANKELFDIEARIATMGADREDVKHNPYYQDLLRIREKLGELNIEIETPSVEVEE